MKKIICLLVLCSAAFYTQAQSQLTNTSWSGIANIPSPEQIELVFGTDSLTIIYNTDPIEVMTYVDKDNKITLTKLTGMSPCSGEKGLYKFSVKDDKLLIEVESDDCSARNGAFSADGYTRMKK